MAARLTVGLLNWKRPENLREVVCAFKMQTEKVEIFLWNNSPDPIDVSVDWMIHSSVNRLCMPRWWMLRNAVTEYVTSFDDDLIPSNSGFVEQLLREMDKRSNKHQAVGAFGIDLRHDLAYIDCPEAKKGDPCDVVLGRQMCVATSSLRLAQMPYESKQFGACDDIVLSGLLASNQRHRVHSIPTTELSNEFALCRRPEHYSEREAARREFFRC